MRWDGLVLATVLLLVPTDGTSLRHRHVHHRAGGQTFVDNEATVDSQVYRPLKKHWSYVLSAEVDKDFSDKDAALLPISDDLRVRFISTLKQNQGGQEELVMFDNEEEHEDFFSDEALTERARVNNEGTLYHVERFRDELVRLLGDCSAVPFVFDTKPRPSGNGGLTYRFSLGYPNIPTLPDTDPLYEQRGGGRLSPHERLWYVLTRLFHSDSPSTHGQHQHFVPGLITVALPNKNQLSGTKELRFCVQTMDGFKEPSLQSSLQISTFLNSAVGLTAHHTCTKVQSPAEVHDPWTCPVFGVVPRTCEAFMVLFEDVRHTFDSLVNKFFKIDTTVASLTDKPLFKDCASSWQHELLSPYNLKFSKIGPRLTRLLPVMDQNIKLFAAEQVSFGTGKFLKLAQTMRHMGSQVGVLLGDLRAWKGQVEYWPKSKCQYKVHAAAALPTFSNSGTSRVEDNEEKDSLYKAEDEFQEGGGRREEGGGRREELTSSSSRRHKRPSSSSSSPPPMVMLDEDEHVQHHLTKDHRRMERERRGPYADEELAENEVEAELADLRGGGEGGGEEAGAGRSDADFRRMQQVARAGQQAELMGMRLVNQQWEEDDPRFTTVKDAFNVDLVLPAHPGGEEEQDYGEQDEMADDDAPHSSRSLLSAQRELGAFLNTLTETDIGDQREGDGEDSVHHKGHKTKGRQQRKHRRHTEAHENPHPAGMEVVRTLQTPHSLLQRDIPTARNVEMLDIHSEHHKMVLLRSWITTRLEEVVTLMEFAQQTLHTVQTGYPSQCMPSVDPADPNTDVTAVMAAGIPGY